MTAHRYEQLKAGATPEPHEVKEFEDTLTWERRSQAAKQAVKTKQAKYKKWPTRRRDHK